MNLPQIQKTSAKALTILVLLCAFAPGLSLAQSATPSTDLSATVRAAILKDPRSQSMTPAQIDTMVAALTAQAQTQGITAQTIAYRPGAVVPADNNTNDAGQDNTSAVILIILAAAVFGILVAIIVFRRLHHPVTAQSLS